MKKVLHWTREVSVFLLSISVLILMTAGIRCSATQKAQLRSDVTLCVLSVKPEDMWNLISCVSSKGQDQEACYIVHGIQFALSEFACLLEHHLHGDHVPNDPFDKEVSK